MSEITGIAPSTIGRGLAELDGRHPAAAVDRVRRRGGGRKPATEKQPGLLAALKSLVEPVERGDPERPLRWVSKSYRHLAGGLRELGYSISYRSIGPLLASLGYSLQGNAKTREGSAHPDRDGQFEAIARQVSAFLAAGEPVISVDTKKKELVGCFKNSGREWRPQGEPEAVIRRDRPGLTANALALAPQLPGHLTAAVKRILQEQLVDPSHQHQVRRALALGQVVERRSADRKQTALSAQAHRVRRLMRLMGLEAIYQAPRTSDSHPAHRIYPYLLKSMAIERANQVWCADITYIPVRRGFLYLVAIMDWATRHVLAWRLSNSMDIEGFRKREIARGAKHWLAPERRL